VPIWPDPKRRFDLSKKRTIDNGPLFKIIKRRLNTNFGLDYYDFLKIEKTTAKIQENFAFDKNNCISK
jgi:hypothetical protein